MLPLTTDIWCFIFFFVRSAADTSSSCWSLSIESENYATLQTFNIKDSYCKQDRMYSIEAHSHQDRLWWVYTYNIYGHLFSWRSSISSYMQVTSIDLYISARTPCADGEGSISIRSIKSESWPQQSDPRFQRLSSAINLRYKLSNWNSP
jgi:hypothetical protein